jgi:WD40 repeat protein
VTGPPPYVGLAPFAEADAHRFFGRDAERRRIIANLMASRLTLLYARSGVGKSSLLRAGVVARLAAGSDSRLVPFVFSSWRDDPNVELPRALGAGGDGLEQALERRVARIDGTLLVILDQFEEFFEYHRGTAEGARFADDLARCVQRTDLRAHLLVSIREDAYSRIGDEFKGRLPNVYSNYLHLDDLDERGARAAIVEPLRHAGNGGASIEPALVDRVLHDVRRDEAANGDARYETAHLQYILRRLWDEEAKRGATVLRLATLEQLGGSAAIFERHFDEAVAGLGSAEQDALAKAFRFLVTSAGMKRAESAADLADLAGVPLATLERALEHLREARVLTPVAAGGQIRYELAHDLLAEPALEWRRERERARELRALRRTAAGLGLVAVLLAGLIVWALLERAAAGRQTDRAEAQKLVAESVNELSIDPERSVRLARDAWQLSEETPQAEHALRRALAASAVRRRLDVGPTTIGALSPNGDVAVSAGPGGTQVWRGLQRQDPAVRLTRGVPVVSADGSVVVVRTVDGLEVAATDGTGGRTTIAGARAPAVSADGRYVAALDRRFRMIVRDARTGRGLARPRVAGMRAPVLAFDPSNPRRLVVGDCLGGTVTVWNWRTGSARTLGGPSGIDASIAEAGRPLCLLALSEDGSRAAQSHLNGSVSLWDLDRGSGRPRELVAGQSVRDIAWVGDRLAIAAGKAATVFDRSGRVLSATPRQIDYVNGVAFDPDGDLMVTISRDGARVWEVRTAGLLTELRGHTDEIYDAAFTAGGRDVVTLSLDGTVRSWRVVDGPVIWDDEWVLDVAFSPDWRRVATASVDGGARITPLRGGRPTSIRGSLRKASSVAFDADGRRIAVAGSRDAMTGQIVVADAATGDIRQQMLLQGQAVLTAAFSPDGEWLVTTGERALITDAAAAPPALWRLSEFRGAGDRPPTATLEMPENTYALRAEFSPDGRAIVTAGSDGVARVYDAGTRRLTRTFTTDGVLLYGATFSPDGRRILTYSSDFTARTWDVRSGRRLAVMRGHTSLITRGEFSPDGRLVVTGSTDQTTRVWDSRTGKPLSTQRMHGDGVNSVDLGPDELIASGGDDGAARVYPCATCEPVQDLVLLARERLVSPR